MIFYSSETRYLIKKWITFFTICLVAYYVIVPNFVGEKQKPSSHTDNLSAASRNAKKLNSDNSYGLSFVIVAKTAGLSWYGAKDFCEKENAAVINRKQAREIIDTVYLAPSANCKKSISGGYRGCLPVVIEEQPLKQYLNSLNSGDPYQISVWTSEKSDTLNGIFLFLTESGASILDMALGNDAIVLCVR